MTVENLEINVKTNVTKDTANKITSLANALGQLEAKASALTGLSHLSELANAMAAISGANVRASAFSGLAKGIENLSSALKTITNNDIANLTQLTTALKGLNNVNLAGLGNTSSVSRAASSLHETAKGIDKVAESAKKAESPLSNFIGSLKRIAFYRIVRTIIKEITEAFKEGLENAYEWSKLMGTELAPALDRIATASLQMKNQLGAALGELIVALEPMIVELIHLITFLAEAFTWLFATLNGSEFYMVAEEAATSWKDADKAAKEYKRTILGFDVINRLNGPGSGGNGVDYTTMFKQTPAGVRDFDFKWKDITPFFAPLDDWADSTMEMLYNLEALLQRIFGQPWVLNLDMAWNLDLPLMEKVKQWLDDLVAASPYVATVTVEVFDPQPQLDAVLGKIKSFLAEMVASAVTANEALRVSVTEKVNQLSEATSTAFEKMRESVRTTLEKTWGNATTVYEKLKTTAISKSVEMGQRVSEEYNKLRTSIGNALSNAHTNVTTFVKSTVAAMVQWARNSAESARAAFVNIAQNVYLGLTNAGENIVNFINSTASNIWSWATNTAQSIVDWANGVATAVGDALSSAWESFKGFMEATGESVSKWWSRNKTWVVPVAIGAAITVAAIALAPATGGASLGALAFAANGGMFDEGQLFIAREQGPELVGSVGGHTAVANNDQIVEAVSNGVYEAVSSAMGSGNKNVSVHVYLDSREIKSGQQRLARAVGG